MNGRTKAWSSRLAQKRSHPSHRSQIRLRTQACSLVGTEQVCSNFSGEGRGSEERVEIEGFGQPPNLAGVEDDRSSSGIDAEVAGVHVGLGENQRLMGNVDVSDGWEPLAELRNSLARKRERLCVSREEWTQSGRQTLLK